MKWCRRIVRWWQRYWLHCYVKTWHLWMIPSRISALLSALLSLFWYYIGGHWLPDEGPILSQPVKTRNGKEVVGLYNPFIGNIHAFLYRATSSSWWYTAYHHEVIHKVLHQNVGLSECLDWDLTSMKPWMFNPYIGADSHFFTRPEMTLHQILLHRERVMGVVM